MACPLGMITTFGCYKKLTVFHWQVIREAADKPREITHKGAADLVTDTDQRSEKVVLGVSPILSLLHFVSLALSSSRQSQSRAGLSSTIT